MQFIFELDTINFNSYDRAIYSFAVMLLSMVDIYFMVGGKIKFSKSRMLLNNTVLVFFALDTLLAVSNNYLVSENIELVAWFWFLRALALQVYYISLIYYLQKDGKTDSHFYMDSN
ncbi:hypothetical protein ACE193_24840 [Bernardetia sp. OM2101]|uniref:hypothetical protein n=1 Tax=Bernardetia sp. OM2101 TaxID=3344876 RepID=UPI0035D03314